MEESVRKVLYETRRHASRPYVPSYPPQQANQRGSRDILSLFPIRAINQLKEKWSGYNQPRNTKNLISLFVSPRGERVAVAAGNQITILQEEDDYQNPCGIFTNNNLATFKVGTWSESHDVLGVVDDTDTLYFVKVNGEEITRITRKHLKVSLPIIGLIAQEDFDSQKNFMCSFSIFTSNGYLQHLEISREPNISISSACASDSGLNPKGQFPNVVFCIDYYTDLSLLAIAGSSGSCYLSLWRKSGILDFKQLVSLHFDGSYSLPRGDSAQVSYPKLRISQQAQFIGTLDVTGRLYIFKVDEEHFTVSLFSPNERFDSQVSNNILNGGKYFVEDVLDFTWWTSHIITIAKRSGVITMLDILSGKKVLGDGPAYSMPVLESVQKSQGHLFLLESTTSEVCSPPKDGVPDDFQHTDQIRGEMFSQYDMSKLQWSLISFSERSVAEMYNVLITNGKYKDALDFADCYGLDKDKALKSQWLQSGHGLKEIDTLLSDIKDEAFVLSECVDKAGPTEDAVKALLAYGLRLTNQYLFTKAEEESSQIWNFRLARLRLLQFKDRLETFLGINMGRFSVQEYSKFRVMPINETAVTLAQSGKIGALNLLFKRHPYSLNPFMLEILAAIPETVPIQTYSQLLPGRSPPDIVVVREADWVECEKMVNFINRLPDNYEIDIQIRTEPIIKQSVGLFWPSINELTVWFSNRARDIDTLSGQLDNCLCLLDFANRKGIFELKQFHDDISCFHQLIYSDDGNNNISVNLITWEELSPYDKFKMMLNGVKEENVVRRLLDTAIPFMHKRLHGIPLSPQNQGTDTNIWAGDDRDESFLVRWMKEIAMQNKLDMCLIVIEEGCRDIENNGFFTNEFEAVESALQCIYLCTLTDKWNIMAGILSKLPQMQDTEPVEDLERRLRLVEGHIEAGRLLSFYQVPKPINFFLEVHSDEKGVKQILRLILSKYIRQQPGRSDNDWANMWRDMQCLREKAFPFLDLEYMLIEFCRGLLKAGRFSLARNYLKGTGSVPLAAAKAEKLVIQAAREYFFSASSLSCAEIWKAKECLDLFPSSRNVKAEVDIIDALTVRLPRLGVTLLPMQFRQIKDPMEIIKMAISSNTGAYLHVDELIEVAKFLGMNTLDDVSTIEEAIAREAAVAGDLQLAFDLCLVLSKKGHGPVWDLCAAIARGPALENMDINSRKQLLGFALSHCDEESISELLNAWKDFDMLGQCETLVMLTGTSPPNFLVQNSSTLFPVHNTQNVGDSTTSFGLVEGIIGEDREVHLDKIKERIYAVAKISPIENKNNLESFLLENGKILSFAALQLPWLVELSTKEDGGKKLFPGMIPGKQYVSLKTQVIVTILSWLARNGFVPTDNLISSLAKSVVAPPVTKEEDLLGCAFLLNLVDAFNGVEVIEEQLGARENYREISSIMNVGMTYSLLHNSSVECGSASQRRELLLQKFKEKHTSSTSEDKEKGKVQSTFWREWKLKLEEQRRAADRSRTLENIIPGVETARFLSGDSNYIQSVVLSLIESIRMEKKHILMDVLKLADTYGLSRSEVLLRYLSSILVSDVWTNDDISVEILEFRGEMIGYAAESIKSISIIVYPAVDGFNKLRLAYIYGLLSDFYLQLEETGESLQLVAPDQAVISSLGLARYYKIIEQECKRVSFIKSLNFKNIAELGGLNIQCFSSEVYTHVGEENLEALAKMVETLSSIYPDPVPEGLISSQDLYKYYVLNLLMTLETNVGTNSKSKSPENLQVLVSQLEQSFDLCRTYVGLLAHSDALDIMKRHLTVILPLHASFGDLPDNSTWQECFITLLNFWIRVADEMMEIVPHGSKGEKLHFSPECLLSCLKVFHRLVVEDSVSPSQGWSTIMNYAKNGLIGDPVFEALIFSRAMIFSGCGFGAITDVFSEVVSQYSADTTSKSDISIQDLPHLYVKILELILQNLVSCSDEHQNLHYLLISLSKLEGSLEDLERVRRVVWARMAEFSDDLRIPSSVRVYVLELMQFITGRSIKGFSGEIQYSVPPWEGWEEFQYGAKEGENVSVPGRSDHKDTSSRFTSTLVALKSTRLAGTISASIEVTSDDLSTVETAVTCFLKLCGAATKDSHFDTLLAILAEWEGYFLVEKNEEASTEETDQGNDWNNDSWDEGWESFQEVEKKDEKTEVPISVNPLHLCWMEIFQKLISFSRFRDLVRLIDQSLPKPNGTLLDEDNARSLSQSLIETDCFVASKVAMLLPYEAIKLQCLDAVEEKLKKDGFSEAISKDLEFLLLALSSGVFSIIASKSSYGTIFSYLCYLVGKFSHRCQEVQLSNLTRRETDRHENIGRGFFYIFRKVTFPCFISKLVKADQQVLAALVLTKFMHTNPSLCLVNIADASLRRFLEKELYTVQNDESGPGDMCLDDDILRNTVLNLKGKLGNLIQAALSLLSRS